MVRTTRYILVRLLKLLQNDYPVRDDICKLRFVATVVFLIYGGDDILVRRSQSMAGLVTSYVFSISNIVYMCKYSSAFIFAPLS